METLTCLAAATAAVLVAGSALAAKPVYRWDFEKDNGKGQYLNGGSGSLETVIFCPKAVPGEGRDYSVGCPVGAAAKQSAMRPLLNTAWPAFTLDISFRTAKLPEGRGVAQTVAQYLYDLYRKAEMSVKLVHGNRFEVTFLRAAKGDAPAVQFKALSAPAQVKPDIYCDLRMQVDEKGELVLWADGVEILRKGGCPSLKGIEAGSRPWHPLWRFGADSSDPERISDYLDGYLDDIALYDCAIGAPEIQLPPKADYSTVTLPSYQAAAESPVDMLLLDRDGKGATGAFRVLDVEGQLAGGFHKAEKKFYDAAAKATLAVDDDWITAVITCPVPAGMKTEPKPTSVFHGDEAEFFIRPSLERDEYYQYCVNAAGDTAALRFSSQGTGDPTFKTRAKMTVENVPEKFVVTVRVPRSEVSAQPFRPGDAFAVNFTRVGKTGGGLSTWAAVGRSFGNPSLFGRVVYGGPEFFFQRRLEKVRASLALRFREADQHAAAEKALKPVEKAVADHAANPAAFTALEQMFGNLDRTLLQIALQNRKLLLYRPANAWGGTIEPTNETEPLAKLAVLAPVNAMTRVPFALANLTDRDFVGQVKLFNRRMEKKFYQDPEPAGIARNFKVYETIPTENIGGVTRLDVVSELPMGTVVRVSARKNGLFWIELDTHGVKPGRYVAFLSVKKAVKGFETSVIPVMVEVVDKDMAAVKAERAEYNQIQTTHYWRNPRLMRDLVRRGVTVLWTNTPGYDTLRITPRWNKDRTKLIPGDMTDLDGLVDAWLAAGAKKEDLRIWVNQALLYRWCSILRKDGTDMAAVGEPEWHEWLEEVVRSIVTRLGERYGIGKKQIIWYLMDEPDGDIDDPTHKSSLWKLEYAAKAMKKIDPEFVLYTDPSPFLYKDFAKFKKSMTRMRDYIDIMQIYRPFSKKEHIELVQSLGFPEVWSYSICSTDSSPVGYRSDFWTNLRDGFREVANVWCWEMHSGGDGIDAADGGGYTQDEGVIYADYDHDTFLESRRGFAREAGFEDARLILYLRRKYANDQTKLDEIERIVRDTADCPTMERMEQGRAALLKL